MTVSSSVVHAQTPRTKQTGKKGKSVIPYMVPSEPQGHLCRGSI